MCGPVSVGCISLISLSLSSNSVNDNVTVNGESVSQSQAPCMKACRTYIYNIVISIYNALPMTMLPHMQKCVLCSPDLVIINMLMSTSFD